MVESHMSLRSISSREKARTLPGVNTMRSTMIAPITTAEDPFCKGLTPPVSPTMPRVANMRSVSSGGDIAPRVRTIMRRKWDEDPLQSPLLPSQSSKSNQQLLSKKGDRVRWAACCDEKVLAPTTIHESFAHNIFPQSGPSCSATKPTNSSAVNATSPPTTIAPRVPPLSPLDLPDPDSFDHIAAALNSPLTACGAQVSLLYPRRVEQSGIIDSPPPITTNGSDIMNCRSSDDSEECLKLAQSKPTDQLELCTECDFDTNPTRMHAVEQSKPWALVVPSLTMIGSGIMASRSKDGISEPSTECDFDTNLTKLYAAIQNRHWELVLRRSSEHPKEASTWVSRKETDGMTPRWRLLPLHAAIIFQAPPTVVGALLGAFNGAHCKDDEGKLPLHLCFRRETDEAVISLLLKAYPQSMRVKDNKGRTPLMLARRSNNPQRDARILIRSLEHIMAANDSGGFGQKTEAPSGQTSTATPFFSEPKGRMKREVPASKAMHFSSNDAASTNRLIPMIDNTMVIKENRQRGSETNYGKETSFLYDVYEEAILEARLIHSVSFQDDPNRGIIHLSSMNDDSRGDDVHCKLTMNLKQPTLEENTREYKDMGKSNVASDDRPSFNIENVPCNVLDNQDEVISVATSICDGTSYEITGTDKSLSLEAERQGSKEGIACIDAGVCDPQAPRILQSDSTIDAKVLNGKSVKICEGDLGINNANTNLWTAATEELTEFPSSSYADERTDVCPVHDSKTQFDDKRASSAHDDSTCKLKANYGTNSGESRDNSERGIRQSKEFERDNAITAPNVHHFIPISEGTNDGTVPTENTVKKRASLIVATTGSPNPTPSSIPLRFNVESKSSVAQSMFDRMVAECEHMGLCNDGKTPIVSKVAHLPRRRLHTSFSEDTPNCFSQIPVPSLKLQPICEQGNDWVPGIKQKKGKMANILPEAQVSKGEIFVAISRVGSNGSDGVSTLSMSSGDPTFDPVPPAEIESYVQSLVKEIEIAGSMKDELENALKDKIKLEQRVEKLARALTAEREAKTKLEVQLTRKLCIDTALNQALNQAEQSRQESKRRMCQHNENRELTNNSLQRALDYVTAFTCQ